jgi:hypothetical protein
MGARDVTGFLRVGGGETSVLIRIKGKGGNKGCSLEDLRARLEEVLTDCGLNVKAFNVERLTAKKKKKK